MNARDICNRINNCSSIERIKEEKEKILSEIEKDHKNKMDILNALKAKHDKELETLRAEIKEAITVKDFNRVSELIKKQATIIAKQNTEMLSVM